MRGFGGGGMRLLVWVEREGGDRWADGDEVWEENLPGEPLRISEAHREGSHRQIGKKDINVPGGGGSLHFYSGGLAGRWRSFRGMGG